MKTTKKKDETELKVIELSEVYTRNKALCIK